MRIRFTVSLVLIVITLITSGCWDYRPMAKRAYVIAIGIDKTKEQSGSNPKITQTDKGKYTVTFQLPNFAGGTGAEASGGGGENHIMLTVEANTMFEAFRRLALTSPWEPYFEHLLVIVISKDVLQGENIGELLDSFYRQEQMRLNIKLFITPTSAKDLLAVKMAGPSQTAFILNDLFKEEQLGYSPVQVEIGNAMSILHQHGDFVLPIAYTDEKTFSIGGGAVFRDGYYVGEMNERKVRAMRLIRGSLKGTVYELRCDEDSKNILYEANSKGKVTITGEKPDDIALNIEVTMDGAVSENQCKGLNPATRESFKKVEEMVSASIKRETNDLFVYMRENNLDLIGIKKKIYQHNPQLFYTMEAQGLPMDPTLPYTINTKIKVKHTGAAKN